MPAKFPIANWFGINSGPNGLCSAANAAATLLFVGFEETGDGVCLDESVTYLMITEEKKKSILLFKRWVNISKFLLFSLVDIWNALLCYRRMFMVN